MSEVKRRICHVCAGMPREYFCGVCDEGRDYDALAAQRDEGLEREAELQNAYDDAISASNEIGYACMSAGDVIRHQNDELIELKQRLAESEKLPDRKSSLDVFSTYGLGEVKGWNDALDAVKKMRGPGCADGEKS